MQESITISKAKPVSPAMDFELLRKEAIAYIQRISGNVWTDYNAHDPGITILEVLCYAITDLSYRANKPIQDLLAEESGSLAGQFFKASEILPGKALTLEDYRKLIMDVEVVEDAASGKIFAGVKNAWITLRQSNEIPVFPDRKAKKLAYIPFPVSEQALQMGILYDVLLEFDATEELGDLNENKLSKEKTIEEHPALAGVVIDIQIEFPRWDENIDWADKSAIRKAIQGIFIQFQNIPSGFELTYKLSPTNYIQLGGTELTATGLEEIDGIAELSTLINDFVFNDPNGILSTYLIKIEKIAEILAEVKRTLNANRNVCEDFVEFHALRVEEILVCADIELRPEADVALTEARIFSVIGDFLSPQVNFYSLEEMLHRCKSGTLPVARIQQNPAKIWMKLEPDSFPMAGSVLSIIGSGNNAGTYKILEIKTASKEPGLAEILLSPNFSSPLIREHDHVFFGDWDSEQCISTEEIFEGPLLKHGFIDGDDLSKADRKSKIHVSDLIHLIMDIEGVLAVKSIQVANLPQDDPENKIPSKSVRWCLDLAFEQNYVPRLNPELSKLIYYKEGLPFKANQEEVEDLLDEIQAEKRPQKIRYPQLDFDEITGEFAGSGDYYSIQNDFPLVYGVGEEGMLPAGESRPQAYQVKQLKAYLMVFEQLLANYLAQLAHVRDLFSISEEKDLFGNPKVAQTYFSQNLESLVPDAADIWKDLVGLKNILNNLTEPRENFLERRNQFLNHLLARFAEQLTDYGLLTVRLSPQKGKERLIGDKLRFLNNYPQIGAERGQGFDYAIPGEFYHIDNLSGLENRVGGLYGIHPRKADWLIFSPQFVFSESGEIWTVIVTDATNQPLFEISEEFSSLENARLGLEKMIMIASDQGNWRISGNVGNLFLELVFDEKILGASVKKDFLSLDPGEDADIARKELQEIFLKEFVENARANRKNLSLGLENWYAYTITPTLAPAPPKFVIDFEFFDAPFGKGNAVLFGKIEQEVPDADSEAELITLADARIKKHIWDMIAAAYRPSGYQLDPDTESPYHFSIIDPIRGGLLAKSVETDFNTILAAQLLDGTWGNPLLLQNGFAPLPVTLATADAQGSRIKLTADQNPTKGDSIRFVKNLEVLAVDVEKQELTIAGDHRVALSHAPDINISLILNGEEFLTNYTIFKLDVIAGKTVITTQTEPRLDLEGGTIMLSRDFEVLLANGSEFLVQGGEEMKAVEKIQALILREFFSHEGTHLIEHILLRPRHKGKYKFVDESDLSVNELIEDRLLDPHFQEECECTLDDPYTCIAHVLLPFWAGRFINRDFRKFLENKLKTEAPAHIFLTICWISPEHMEELEQAWKIWLLESLKNPQHPKQLSTALAELIEVFGKVRNVYPSGTLHDCAEDDTLADAIILNFSSLGEF
ncbi:hypothetical protein [Dyadobacter fanqingshengii]|uniref:Uncharacterized protein n=1 Tax=Dyadobacter fanqingshengii TaxID=2906443 RepID=A0A9X1P8T1_9BACT|nr:hypothetical protein [Dyadobacter fanqingshengii]MCF0039779.1 hypothetical protein [Dyadobacter fanqingshengii]USJ38458.1 hypothetical protein NFI81_11885 [Dyadobacter fanqingshengii]